MTQTLEQRVKYSGWKDPEQAIANVKHALMHDIPGLEELVKAPKRNKAKVAKLIRESIKRKGDIMKYHASVGIATARDKKSCPVFEGNAYQVITKSFSEFEFDDVLDLGNQYTGWKDPKKAKAKVKQALLRNIPGLEKLLEAPKKNKKKAAKLIRESIKRDDHIQKYFVNIGIGCAGNKDTCPVFKGERYKAISESFSEFEFDDVLDLGKLYTKWKDSEQAKANVKHAVLRSIPRLEKLVNSPKKNKAKIAKLIRERINKDINQYFRDMGVISSLSKACCPFFEGSGYKAISESFSEFEFDYVVDLGKEYVGWNDPEQARANVKHAVFHDIPELENLVNAPKRNKVRAAKLIRDRIRRKGDLMKYLTSVGIVTAACKSQCPVFKGNSYGAISESFSEFEFDDVLDLGKVYMKWNNPKQARANVKHAVLHDIPELERLLKAPKKNKARAAKLLKDKINANIVKYASSIGIDTTGSKARCPVFKGDRYRAISESFSEFEFDDVLDLGKDYTDWISPKQARANVKHAVLHDIPELERLLKAPKRNKEKATKLIRNRIRRKGDIMKYLASVGISSASNRDSCPVFEGNRYKVITESFSEFELKIEELESRYKKSYFDFGNGAVRFDSGPERIVGMLLNKYGLINKFEKGENLHVRTNGSSLQSLDFLVGNCFVEYHPLQRSDAVNGNKSVEKTGQRKFDNIHLEKHPEFGDYVWFFHIWEIDQLYGDVLKDRVIKPKMNKRYQNLTRKQFEKHVEVAYEQAAEYDAKHPNQTRKLHYRRAA